MVMQNGDYAQILTCMLNLAPVSTPLDEKKGVRINQHQRVCVGGGGWWCMSVCAKVCVRVRVRVFVCACVSAYMCMCVYYLHSSTV